MASSMSPSPLSLHAFLFPASSFSPFPSPSSSSSLPLLISSSSTASSCRRRKFLLLRRPSPFLLPPPWSSSSHLQHRAQRISTAPVEHASAPDFDFGEEVSRLRSLRSRLRAAASLRGKARVLDSDSRVRDFLAVESGGIARVLGLLDPDEVFLVKCLVAAGQGHVLVSELELEGRQQHLEVVEKGGLRTALSALADMVENWSLDGSEVRSNGLGHGRIIEELELEYLKDLLKMLGEVEHFYDCIGGIIGYQIMALELLSSQVDRKTITLSPELYKFQQSDVVNFYVPNGLDLLENSEDASQAALWGIQGLPELGEIYPLGGAGDRLGLVDPGTGECLPAALLPYCGRTLLEGLIRDLQAREFLYFKLYGKQCITPIAIMTSAVKKNHEHITALCERFRWFGRGKENFRLFEQPLVPVVAAENGRWLITRPLSPVCKPGGHGAIWKLAYDKGIFQWFYGYGRKAATIRQVSNSVAATDLTLLALAGLGLHYNKELGFASCQRNLGATEGINVLVEKQNLEGQWAYGITCIEYTEFEKFGIADAPTSIGREVNQVDDLLANIAKSQNFDVFWFDHPPVEAQFPANTNILYVDLRSAEKIGSSQSSACLPGMVLNLKKPISYVDHHGIPHSALGGRLECTMQNIADSFLNTFNSRRNNKEIETSLNTFIVYNERKRVTSSAKRKRKKTDKSLHQTPDGSLLDVIRNAYDLLSGCNIELPKVEDNNKYLTSGPPFLIFLHPALGPLWEVTRQKFNGGSISEGSELQVEVAEFLWRDVQLDGSLIVSSENIMGMTNINENLEPIIRYGSRCGRCKLQNVKVGNKGIDWTSSSNVYWRHEVHRTECLRIILHGNAEFEAKDVVLKGDHEFIVPDGYHMCISPGKTGFDVLLKPISVHMMETGTWFWKYRVKGAHIHLEMVNL